jgi:hypothetical protein
MSNPEMRASNKRATDRANAVDRHFERLYKRLDNIDARVSKLERVMYVMTGLGSATVVTAVYNLVQNLQQSGAGQ